MRFLPHSISVLLLILLMTSCRAPKDLVFKDYKNLSIDNLGFSESILKVDLIYFNPNNFGLDLSRSDLDLYVDGAYLGHSSQNLQIPIKAKKEFTLPLKISLDMKNLLKNGYASLFNKEINVRLLGNVKVGKAGVYKNFKVDYISKQNFSLFK